MNLNEELAHKAIPLEYKEKLIFFRDILKLQKFSKFFLLFL